MPPGSLLGVERPVLVRSALRLAVLTLAWNVVEGVIALLGASRSGSRALLGFGVDSFVESASAAVLIWRLRVEQLRPELAGRVERRALRLIGVSFLMLAGLVAIESSRTLVLGEEPDSSGLGITLAGVSLIVMPLLARAKRRVAVALGSRAAEADSSQTMACTYLSAVVLIGLGLNAALGWWWADPIAALGVAYILVIEGRSALTADEVGHCC